MSFIYDMTATWNDATEVFNGIKMDVSDGSSGTPVYATGSKLINLLKNGTSMFSVDPDGNIIGANSISLFRQRLYQNTVFYVNTSGTDVPTNGRSSGASAWRTIAYGALQIINSVDINGFSCTLLVEAGTYNESANIYGAVMGSSTFTIQGASAATVTVVAQAGGYTFYIKDHCCVTLKDMTLNSAAGTAGHIFSSNNSITDCYALTYTGASPGFIWKADESSDIALVDSQTINSTACAGLAAATLNGVVNMNSRTIALAGTPNFTSAGILVAQGGVVNAQANYTGTATGLRFAKGSGGVILTNSNDPTTYLPGSTTTGRFIDDGFDVVINPQLHLSATNYNVGIGVTSFGTNAVAVLGILSGVAPASSPANMGQLYVLAGSLQFRGSSGTVTSLAAA